MDLKLVLTAQRSVSVLALLDYSAHEPYSVRATFRTSDGDVNWVFARELIAEGLRKPAGDGDIAMWPSKTNDREVLCLSLSSPSGQALMEAPRDVIEEFLARSYRVVPLGSESALIDMDLLIDRLLDSGGAASL
ncbi:MAG: hypothetical protein ACJAY5_001953 [Actinomycetes bacterium]|jgi:hypothetical protein